MAFYNENDDKDQELAAQEGQPVQTGAESSTIGTAGGTASPDAQKASTASAPSSGGGPNTFAGIQDYVNANKQQTAKLAGDVGGLVTNYGNEARTQIGQGQEKFNQAVDQNTVNLDERVFNTAKNTAEQVTANQPDLQTFTNMRDAQYKGPASLETSEFYEPLNKAYTTAKTASDNTQSDAGQRELLTQLQQQQRGKVNQGSLSLNSALLQGDTNARSILDNVRDANSDLEGLYTNAKTSAAAKATAGKTTTDATRQAVLDTFSGDKGVQSNLEKALVDRSKDLIGQSKQQANDLVSALKTGANLTPAQIKALGISKEQYDNLVTDMSLLKNTYGNNSYNDISRYATQIGVDPQINAQNAASAEEYARYEALNQLMGTQNKFLNDPTQAGKAGDVQLANLDVNNLTQNMQTGIASKQSELDAKARRLWEIGAHGRSGIDNDDMWYWHYPSYQAYLNDLASAQNTAASARAATEAANAKKATNFQAIQDFLNNKK